MTIQRILLVEDDVFLARALKHTLEGMGYAVVHLLSAAEAMDHAEEFRPDAIVMDVYLGRGIDGIDAARAIRRAHEVPVIFLTARCDDATRARAKFATPAAYLSKSCAPEELHAALESALRLSTV